MAKENATPYYDSSNFQRFPGILAALRTANLDIPENSG